MLERFKRTDAGQDTGSERDAVATAERTDDTAVQEHERPMSDTAVDDRERTADTAVVERERIVEQPVAPTADATATPAALEAARLRQRDEFGGVNWGASFFGWLVAVGVATLLVSLLVAAGAAVGLTESDVTNSADEITLGGAIALIAVLMIAYYAGGYVAGRMSRFDGARQGLATWAIGLIVTVALAVAAIALGDEYNVLEQLNLPALPVGEDTLASGGAIALAAIAVGSAIAAMAGGKVGERYHRRVDRAGFVD
jgi:hypothetical protein